MSNHQVSIVLDNPNGRYLPGDILSGQVVLNTNKEQLAKGLPIKLKGKGVVRWTETETASGSSSSDNPGTPHTVTYKDFQNIIILTSNLLGDGSSTTIVPAGRSSYPFRFQLPSTNLPCTYDGKLGRIEYTLSAKFIREGLFTFNYKEERDVVVLPFLDLNRNPTSLHSGKWSYSKTRFFGDNHLSMHVSLDAHGYCPGDEIRTLVEFTDKKSKNVERVTAEIKETTTFRARKKTKHHVSSFSKTNVKKTEGVEEVWEGTLTLPVKLLPTQLGGGCNIISLEYILKVKADTGKFSSMKMKCPVTIGTVPFRGA